VDELLYCDAWTQLQEKYHADNRRAASTSLQSANTLAKAHCNGSTIAVEDMFKPNNYFVGSQCSAIRKFYSPAILLTWPGKPAEFWQSGRKF
jgi:hypothetical protein